MSVATTLTNEIIGFLYGKGAYAWRASSTGIFDSRRGGYRTAPKKGVSDILACYKGRLIAIEVKIGKDRLSPEQEGFLANIDATGGITCIARDLSTFTEWWQEKYP